METESHTIAKEIGVANKQTIRWNDFVLRFLAFVVTLVAAIVLGVSKQNELVPVQLVPTLPPINVPASAKWSHMSAFVYFVIVNAIACAYAVISLVLSLANKGKTKGLSLTIILFDLIMMALLYSSVGAAAAVGLIGYKGNTHVRWNKVCDVFGKFCGQVVAAIVISLVGSILFLLLVLLATVNLHKTNTQTAFPLFLSIFRSVMPEPHLNGAYYGPSIPPPLKTYHRPGHGGGGGGCCCNPFTCCCSCIFNCICTCIFQILCTLLVIIAVVGFILWFVLRPNKVNFHISDASLTQFDFSTKNNTLHYDLHLNVSIRNPNKRIGIYYDSIEARAMYHGQNFSIVKPDPFYQGHKNTTDLNLVFTGQESVQLGSEYNFEKDTGVYQIGLRLYLRIRFKFSLIKTKKIKPIIDCDLKVPFKGNGTFKRTQCNLDW